VSSIPPATENRARLMAELTYEVSFKGVASPTLRAAFVDCELEAGMGVTSVRCAHGAVRTVIARIEEFGLELLDVRLIAGHPTDHVPPPDA
jgi:hypothetical protein